MPELNPQNIHCLALNYHGVGSVDVEPLYFIKSRQALCFDGAQIHYPERCENLWTEVELVLVIKKHCCKISVDEAVHYIAGFTVGADITCANVASRDHHLAYSKSRKNFCPVSQGIVSLSPSELDDLQLTTSINSKITQTGGLSQMILNPFRALSYVSYITELDAGDILLTGTPAGVENNRIWRGDHVRHEIEKIGSLRYEIV